ncbi:MAG TPA: AbrB family transcriptional regulator [Thermosynechococcaceae cyanobacterium]
MGGIAAGAIGFYSYRSRYDSTAKPNKNSRKIGQVLVGLSIGFSVDRIDWPILAAQLPAFVLLTGFLLLSSGCISLLYARIGSTDLVTALFASVPGNIGVMASLAADYGKNAAIVSLVQLTRFTSVTLIVPLVANVPVPRDLSAFWQPIVENLQNLTTVDLLLLTLLLLLTYLAVSGGSKLKIPVATLFCPLLVGLAFVSLLKSPQLDLGIAFKFPPLLSWVGQVLLGITIGEYWAVNPKLEKRTIALALVPALLTFLAGFASAGIARLFTQWDWLTCLLVTSPGGSPEMILIALVLNHDVQIVTIGHLIRLIAINLSLPALIAVANSLESRQKSPVEKSLG